MSCWNDILRDESLFFWKGGGVGEIYRHKQIFFSYKHTNNFFSGNGFANNFFAPKCNALL